jgi:hypothetical protein
MKANAVSERVIGQVLTVVILVLTLATAYVHLSLGGTIFLLNGIGYATFLVAILATSLPIAFLRRIRWLPRLGLAGFALVTIVAYLVIGPYSLLGWSIKAIEFAIIGVVGAELINTYGSARRLERAPAAPLERSAGPAAG